MEQMQENPIPERRVGESFKPFKNLTGFKFEATEKNEGDTQEDLFVHEFRFKNANYSLSINGEDYNPDKCLFAELGKITPLGKVKLVKSVENGNVTIEEMPLVVFLKGEIPSLETYRELKKYSLEFKFGDDSYYMSLAGDDWIRNEENFHPDEEVKEFSMVDSDGKYAGISFPSNVDKMRNLDVNIIEKDSLSNRPRFRK